MSSNYRPRDAAQRARGLAARQFCEFPEPLVADDEFDDLEEVLDGELAEGEGPELPEWQRRIADRTPPGLRSARVRVGPRAAVGVLLVACLLAGVLGFSAWRSWPRAEPPAGEAVPERSAPVVAAGPAPVTPTSVVVHVAGRVAAPGVVTLPAGSRVGDALAAAGGAGGDANLDAVNLARVLVDGEQVLVPSPGEVVAAPAGGGVAGGGVAGGGVAGGGVAGGSGLLDLNSADAGALDTLPGVGEVLAGRIVAWREENGRFSSVDDLGEVQGIGPKVLEDLRDLVTV